MCKLLHVKQTYKMRYNLIFFNHEKTYYNPFTIRWISFFTFDFPKLIIKPSFKLLNRRYVWTCVPQ